MYKISDNCAEYVFLNNEIISYKNLEFDRPYDSPIIYEVTRFIDSKGVFLKDHYDRLCNSLKIAGIKNILSLETLSEACSLVLKKNNLKNNNLKWIYAVNSETKQPEFLIYASKSFYPDNSYYENGIEVAVLEIERPDPNAKISRKEYIEKVNSFKAEKGVFELLLMNKNGELTEGSRSNLFFIKDNTVYTAPKEVVLEGIMRKYVFEICDKYNILIDDSRSVDFKELSQMDAAFITGTSINVLPLSAVEDVTKFNVKNDVMVKIMHGFEERIVEEWQKK